jgi:RNA polymerase sigma factor (sigma-70 family)
MNEDLEELAARVAAGDQAALPELLQAIRPQVQRRVSKFLPYREDAEEAAQDTLMTVATKIHTFKGTGSFAGWLTVVATNQARQTYRSLKRRSVEQSAEVLPEAVDPRTTSVIAGSRLDLLEALESLESSHPQLVQPLVLRDLGAMTYAEIADELDVPLGTVKARIHQARKEVAERLTVR